ncbi:MAG TPA: carboxypeptidase-like regulatory domain-containing protein, partial [Candidatus Solibacter sp.]|nr:carboxypeptidase-like regulatory domain-containing protein [Candidatus Solibacter sp.]
MSQTGQIDCQHYVRAPRGQRSFPCRSWPSGRLPFLCQQEHNYRVSEFSLGANMRSVLGRLGLMPLAKPLTSDEGRKIMEPVRLRHQLSFDSLKQEAAVPKQSSIWLASLAAVCLLTIPLIAPAQTTTGSIVGTVTDPSGGAVPGAAVTVTNDGTGITVIRLTTDSTGTYVATALPPGRYSITVEAPGFKKSANPGINLSVQDRLAVNVSLEVGQVTETVEVASAAQQLQTDSSYLGQVVEAQRIVDLPLNGRFFTRLAMLTSGTLPTPPGARDERTGGFSSNGVRPYQNSYLLDGIDNNSLSQDLTNEASFVYGPSPDAIAEFRVQTNSMSAEFGRSGGAVMNVNIKSGSNEFHGSAFEFLRNDKVDARNFFAGSVKPEYRLNQFGGAVGGPVRKNSSFFFADYQGTRQRTGQTFLSTVAPVAWKSGDFNGFNPVLDPTTKQPFANNRVPSTLFDGAAVKLISLMPSPTAPGSVSFTGVANNYLINPVEPSTTDQGDIRIDHKIGEKDSIFGRFSMSNQNLSPPSPIPPPLAGAQFGSGDWTNNTRSAVISETHIFSPRIINEFRIGYTRLRSERLQFNSDENLSAQIGIPGIPFSPGNGGLPRFDVSGV